MFTDKQILKIRKGFNGVDQRAIFRVLSDANRYHILELLTKKVHLGVSDIAKVLTVSVPLASQHLKILEQADILEKEKQGQRVCYKIQTKNKIIQSIIKNII